MCPHARRHGGPQEGEKQKYPLLSFGVLALGAALFVVAQKFVKDNVVFRNCVRAAGVLLAAVGVWALACCFPAARSFRWAESAPKGKGHAAPPRQGGAGTDRANVPQCGKAALRHLEGQGGTPCRRGGQSRQAGGRGRIFS